MRRAYRALWKATLDGTPAHAAGPALRDEAAVVRELARLAGAAHRLASDVETLARVRGGFDLARLEDAARRLEEADATIVRFGTIHALVTPLTQMFRFEKESLVGEDVWALAAATRELHGALDAQARLLAELLDPSPQPARSRAEERRIHHGSVD